MEKEKIHDLVLRTLEALRGASSLNTYIYLNGGCYKLYELLKIHFPDAVAWYDGVEGHIYTEIEGRFYDIEGEHDKKAHWYELSTEPDIEKAAKMWKCDNICSK